MSGYDNRLDKTLDRDVNHLSSSAQAGPNSPAVSQNASTGNDSLGETTVWLLNCRRLELTAQWTNSDGCKSFFGCPICPLLTGAGAVALAQNPTTIFFDPRGCLGLTGDLDQYNTAQGSEAFPVVRHVWRNQSVLTHKVLQQWLYFRPHPPIIW